jgi:hypothetical protein
MFILKLLNASNDQQSFISAVSLCQINILNFRFYLLSLPPVCEEGSKSYQVKSTKVAKRASNLI